ncbi:hypothetical protein PHLCEN_2v4031, partial [Hermanssonia centrifuga]
MSMHRLVSVTAHTNPFHLPHFATGIEKFRLSDVEWLGAIVPNLRRSQRTPFQPLSVTHISILFQNAVCPRSFVIPTVRDVRALECFNVHPGSCASLRGLICANASTLESLYFAARPSSIYGPIWEGTGLSSCVTLTRLDISVPFFMGVTESASQLRQRSSTFLQLLKQAPRTLTSLTLLLDFRWMELSEYYRTLSSVDWTALAEQVGQQPGLRSLEVVAATEGPWNSLYVPQEFEHQVRRIFAAANTL